MAVEGPFDPKTIVIETSTINEFNIEIELKDFKESSAPTVGYDDFLKFQITDEKNSEFKSFVQYRSLGKNNFYLFRKESYKNSTLDGHQMESIYDCDHEYGRKDSYYIDGKCQAEHTTYFKDGIEIKRSLNKNENEHGIQTEYFKHGTKTVKVVNDGKADNLLSKKLNKKLNVIKFCDNFRFLFSKDHLAPQDRFQQQIKKASIGLAIN